MLIQNWFNQQEEKSDGVCYGFEKRNIGAPVQMTENSRSHYQNNWELEPAQIQSN